MSAVTEIASVVSTSEKLQALRSVDCYPVPATSVELIDWLVDETVTAVPARSCDRRQDRHDGGAH